MPAQTDTAITRAMARWGSPKNAEDAPNDFHRLAAGPPLGLKISEKIKRLFHREPPTEGELEARAEAAASRAERAANVGEAELLTRKPG